ncbi:MAG: hypothetical protein KF796_02450 [Ramlibacter sp.]|nr:hypothetical protein [Ramlibacter sp.]
MSLSACGGGGGGGDAANGAGGNGAPVSFNVGGTLAGLAAGKTVVLAHKDASGATAQSRSLNANGAYSVSLPAGTAYQLVVLVQPSGQTCSVSNGTGTASADVNNVSVNCLDNVAAPEARVVSGTVAGLAAGQTLVLQLSANGQVQETSVHADGSFQFPEALTGTFAITVKTPPAGQGCSVAHSQGTAGDGVAISVSCTAASQSFRVGGQLSGNIGVVALRNTANGDALVLSANGVFQFPQPVPQGSAYNVVRVNAGGVQTCSVGNGSGTASAHVSNISIRCAAVVPVSPPLAVPSVPAGLTMTYDVKRFDLAWGTVTAPFGGGTVSYQLFEDPDGAGPTASVQIGGTLTGATYTQGVSGLLHTRLNAQYRVQACNTTGCSALSSAITPHITQAVGYFKGSNTQASDLFGSSVALSADGSTLAVGAYWESSNATGIDGDQSNNAAPSFGAVYVFIRSGTTWSQQAYVKASNSGAGDRFGLALALSADGNTLAVAAVREDSAATGIDGNQASNGATDAGAVYVFARSGATWTQQAYVKASNAEAQDWFGLSLALSGDGNTLAVGASQESSNATAIGGNQADNSAFYAGAVYVFSRSGVTWTQQAYVKASNTASLDQFGTSVALGSDGNTLAVGAPGEDSNATGIDGNEANDSTSRSGAVYVFARSGATWTQQAYVKASNPGVSDLFGTSVSLAGDGNTLAVGAEQEASNATGVNGDQANNSLSNAGAVYVFARGGVTWSQQAYVKASNTGAGDKFGSLLTLSADGSALAVGANAEASNATGLDGDQANNSATSAGAVYVFSRSGATWSQQAYVKASNAQALDYFGSSVSLAGDGNTLAVGAWQEDGNATGIGGNQGDNSGSSAGAAYVY